MSVELKIKSKHLSFEPAIIKHEERKLRKQIEWHNNHQIDSDKLYFKLQSLYMHRIQDVSNEARATFLARAYIDKMPYKVVEQNVRDENKFKNIILPRVVDMVMKYNTNVKKRYDKEKNKFLYPQDKLEFHKNAILEWYNS